MTRKLSLSYSALSLARALSYAMPLNTCRVYHKPMITAVYFLLFLRLLSYFYIALRSIVIRCLWNYFDKAALMRIINENVSDGCPLFSFIILTQSAFQRPHSVDCLTKCNAAVVWRYQAMSQYFKALFLQSFIHHFQ